MARAKMRCKAAITAAADRAVLVRRDRLLTHLDEADLACRESEVVADHYLSDWFYFSSANELHFTPPAFALQKRRTVFINGRHRAVLLMRHMEVLPVLVTNVDSASADVLGDVVVAELTKDYWLTLPDLPITGTIERL